MTSGQRPAKMVFLSGVFRLVRHAEQQPIKSPEDQKETSSVNTAGLGTEAPERTSVTTSRVIRNSQVGNKIKELYDHQCQVCGTKLKTPTGPYAECCHIRPLGKPHNGPDTVDTVLCLCPNCHVLFDNHAIQINEDFSFEGYNGSLSRVSGHDIKLDYINYHKSISRISQ